MHSQGHPGGTPGANLKSISHRFHPVLVAFVWELTKETIHLPLGCLQGGWRFCLFKDAGVADPPLSQLPLDGAQPHAGHLTGRSIHASIRVAADAADSPPKSRSENVVTWGFETGIRPPEKVGRPSERGDKASRVIDPVHRGKDAEPHSCSTRHRLPRPRIPFRPYVSFFLQFLTRTASAPKTT